MGAVRFFRGAAEAFAAQQKQTEIINRNCTLLRPFSRRLQAVL
jgi:hypothetical protein